MTKPKLTHVAAGMVIASLCLLGAATAQLITQQDISGNECWVAGQGPAGPTVGFLCVNTVRNSANITTTSGSGSATSTGIGGTLTWTSTAPTTWTVTLPTHPPNGTVQRINSATTLTTLVTVQAGGSDTLSGTFSSQTLTANVTVAAWQYNLANTTWYRVQ